MKGLTQCSRSHFTISQSCYDYCEDFKSAMAIAKLGQCGAIPMCIPVLATLLPDHIVSCSHPSSILPVVVVVVLRILVGLPSERCCLQVHRGAKRVDQRGAGFVGGNSSMGGEEQERNSYTCVRGSPTKDVFHETFAQCSSSNCAVLKTAFVIMK